MATLTAVSHPTICSLMPTGVQTGRIRVIPSSREHRGARSLCALLSREPSRPELVIVLYNIGLSAGLLCEEFVCKGMPPMSR